MLRFILLIFALLIIPAEAANRFAVCTVTCTWDNSSTAMWSTSTGGATGASVPGSSDAVILDAATCVGGVTCTVTVNTTVTVQSITMGACTAATTGCILDFSANNNNVTLTTTFSCTGTGTRTLSMGNGAWTLSGTNATPWSCATTTNLTFNKNSSTLVFNLTGTSSQTFAGGALSYGTTTFNANTNAGPVITTGANTFSSLVLNGLNTIQFAQAVTTTITNAFTWTGTSSAPLGILSQTLGTTATISVASGAPSMDWAVIKDITFTGGATFTATNSINLGHNSGISISVPSVGGAGGKVIGG